MDKYLTSIDEFTSYDDVENQLAMIKLVMRMVVRKIKINLGK